MPSTMQDNDTSQLRLPKPDKVVHFEAYSRGHAVPEKTGALFVFGDSSSEKVALLCAGYPDDHSNFLPFGEKLASRCNGIMVGVMCLPGYDDRPEDGVGWETHPPEGFRLDEWTRAVGAAAKTLVGLSTYTKGKPEFIGIFHDWGCVPGTEWAQQVEHESDDDAAVVKPDKLVYLDVLSGPPKFAKDDPVPMDAIQKPTLSEILYILYMPLNAISSAIYTHVSKSFGMASFLWNWFSLELLRIAPVYPWDRSGMGLGLGSRAFFETKDLSLLSHMVYMTFPYRRIFTDYLFKGKPMADLHEDWKKVPILYLYGMNKRASYHDPVSYALLEREFKEKRSLSNALGIADAGHWLYHQKEDECLEHITSFAEAKNTFRD